MMGNDAVSDSSLFRLAKGARASDAMRAEYARRRRTRISPVILA